MVLELRNIDKSFGEKETILQQCRGITVNKIFSRVVLLNTTNKEKLCEKNLYLYS